jgi:hypothetical protein
VSDVSRKQVQALQALWHVYARRTLGFDANDRAKRLEYYSNYIGRPIASTLDLTFADASSLINLFKKSLNQRTDRPRDKQTAQALGREGRRGNADNTSTLVDDKSLAVIRDYRLRLGWSADEYTSFLAGKNSPLGGRTMIRTIGDARSVQWAMKKILKAKGLWNTNARSAAASASGTRDGNGSDQSTTGTTERRS